VADAIVYHVGFLPVDRLYDPGVDAVAEAYLEKGTPRGVRVRPARPARGPYGLGEGFLTQRKRDHGIYEYMFTPRRDRGYNYRHGPQGRA